MVLAAAKRSSWLLRLPAFIGVLLGLVIIAAPFVAKAAAIPLIGFAVLLSGLIQFGHAFWSSGSRPGASAFVNGEVSVLVGAFLLASPLLATTAFMFFVGASFAFAGLVTIGQEYRTAGWGLRTWGLARGSTNIVIGVLLGLQWPVSGTWLLAILVGIRTIGAGLALLRPQPAASEPPPSPLVDHPQRPAMHDALTAEENARAGADRSWRIAAVATFFAIHVGRMEAEWTAVGLLSPAVATVGDILVAVLLALFVIMPVRLLWIRLTGAVERRAWDHLETRTAAGRRLVLGDILVARWLRGRTRFSLRMEGLGRSPFKAFGRALQTGLPLTVILVATVPLWGFSWVFNTENWASGFWQQWVAERTDTWRADMVQAVRRSVPYRGISHDSLFTVAPGGVAGANDFSFIVIGDTGEGDASQHVLRDQYLSIGQRPDVRFLLVSSDVIYPAGAMKDYERCFYLPFKGFTKPIYAIPGNHDWFDALEGFAANFYEPEAARATITARVETDHGLTTTTRDRIEALIREAARLRTEYGVRTGLQRAPYFELHAGRFSLVAVDTGVLKQVDADQLAWFRTALERSRGTFTMVVLGHPLYAAHQYQAGTIESFAEIHRLLREYEVPVVMAGDTHDFEYYRETYPHAAGPQAMHHFVNGGGGAYLSIGTALDWPATPVVPDCAFYPATDPVVAKLDSQTPMWKQPLWQWVKRFGAWPLSSEALAAAFDFNAAPFFQSFMEVRVEGSSNLVHLLLYGANGRLKWRDLRICGQVMPPGATADDFVEFGFPLNPRANIQTTSPAGQ